MPESQFDHRNFRFLAGGGEIGERIRIFDWSKMADAAPAMLWVTEADGSCSFLSRGWYEFSGQTEDDAYGWGWLQAMHPEDRVESGRVFLEANAQREPFTLDYRLRRVDGEYRWCIDAGRPRFDEAGHFQGFVGSVIDINEQKRAEQLEREQRTALEILGRPLRECLIALTEAVARLCPGVRACVLTTEQDRRAMAQAFTTHFPPSFGESLRGAPINDRQIGTCDTAIYNGRPVTCTDIQDSVQWSPFWKQLCLSHGIRACHSIPIFSAEKVAVASFFLCLHEARDPDGWELRVAEFGARLAGITLARNQDQQALRESEERFRAFTDATNDVVYRMSPDWTELRHLQGREFIVDTLEPSRTWLDQYIPSDDQPHVWETIQQAIRSRSMFELEHRVIRQDGSLGLMCSRAVPILDPHGVIVEWLGAASDVTHRKEAEKAFLEAQGHLERWNMELEQAVTGKTAELIQSQEQLRALSSELNLTEQRERKRLAAELHDHLQQVLVLGKLVVGQGRRAMAGHSQCEAVLNRVDSVLSGALTYSRTFVAELSPPVLHDHGLVAGLKWLAKYMKKKQDLNVKVVVPEDQSFKLPDDQRVVLFQATRELLLNCVKHAGTRKASILLERRENRLYLTVSDEGSGFNPAALSPVFVNTPEGKVSSKFGLFNIRERMRAMGGAFTIQSAIGQGTVATLCVSLASSAEPKMVRPEFTGKDLSGSALSTQHPGLQEKAIIRVLLVDDHAMVRQGLCSVLDAYTDIQVVGEAGDGEEAVMFVERLRPAVVVMDINMPKMNGIEATKQIKKQHPQTIVIGVSVNAAGENQEAMMHAGAARLITKEAAVEELYDAIQKAIRSSQVDRSFIP